MTILNIEKRTNRIVDVNQKYDERYFDNREVPDDELVRLGLRAGARYTFDADTQKAVHAPAAVTAVQHVLLKKDQPFGMPHSHLSDQLIVVLSGSVKVNDVLVEANHSHVIKREEDHVIVGNDVVSLLITLLV